MIKAILTLVFALLAASVGRPSQVNDYFIDLTALDRSTDAEVDAVPMGELVTTPVPAPFAGSPPPSFPFEISALTADRSDYKIRQAFTYELTLRYVGQGDFTFPIETKMHLFRGNMPGLRKAVVSVEFDDPDWRHQTIDVQPLYGSSDVPGSLVTLTANQTIGIRGACRWLLRSVTPDPPSTWSANVMVFAGLQIFFAPVEYRSGRSISGLSVHLARSR